MKWTRNIQTVTGSATLQKLADRRRLQYDEVSEVTAGLYQKTREEIMTCSKQTT